MLERDVQRLHALAGEHRTHRLDGGAYHQRYVVTPGGVLRRAHAQRRGFEIQRVLCRLEQQRVHAAREQAGRLDLVRVHDVIEGHVARDADRARRRAHGADDEAVTGGLAREASSGHAQLVRAVGEPVLAEHVGRAAEGVRGDDVGACVDVGRVDLANEPETQRQFP